MDLKEVANLARDSIYYNDETVMILLGDCKQIIKLLSIRERFDLIITDPPYEFQASGGGVYKDSENMQQIKEAGTDSFDFDSYIPSLTAWQSFGSNKVNAYFFCNKELLDKYLVHARNRGYSFDVLFMRKSKFPPAHNTHYDPDIEYVVFIRSSGATFNGTEQLYPGLYSKVYEYQSQQKNLLHPNQKPIGVLKKYITISSSPGDIVIDPFMGSGQTLKAARELGRRAIGIEINQKFAEIAKVNLSQLELGL